MWTNLPNTFIMREIRSSRRHTFLAVMILGFVIITFLFSYAAFGQQAKLETLVSVHVVSMSEQCYIYLFIFLTIFADVVLLWARFSATSIASRTIVAPKLCPFFVMRGMY